MAIHLHGRRLFDLATGRECPDLDELAATLQDGEFTDIIAIPTRSAAGLAGVHSGQGA